MSEYVTVCPQCHQPILGDTDYIGMPVACPMCSQAITLPPPPAGSPAPPAPAPAASAPPVPPIHDAPPPPEKRMLPLSPVLVGAVVLVLAAAAGLWAMKNAGAKPESPVATVAPTIATTPTPTPATADQAASTLPTPAVVQSGTAAAERHDECRALWTFDEGSGVTARDGTGHGYDATLVGDHATWTKTAKVGAGALRLSGACYAETAGPVVDTSRSFTVAAWVNLNALDKHGCETMVAMDGTKVSAFYLQFNHVAGDRFVFNRRASDDDDLQAKAIWAKTAFSPMRNTWYHLAGVYDAEAQTISLYVDGKLQESVPFTSPWRATGKTSIGRGFFAQANTDFVNGTIDDVRFYASALTAGQIEILATK